MNPQTEKRLPTIFAKEEHEFLRLWHSYHAKYKIPYNHDEARRFFESVLMIFKEG